MNSEPTGAIVADGVTRRFGPRWVLRGVSLTVSTGEVVALLGANGSGKSTLLRILATLLRAHGGRALVGGCDTASAADEVRSTVGFLAHAPGLYEDLSARENLAFAAAMLGSDTKGPHGIDAQLKRVGLSAAATSRVRGFSAGMQRRLALARLLFAKDRTLTHDRGECRLVSGRRPPGVGRGSRRDRERECFRDGVAKDLDVVGEREVSAAPACTNCMATRRDESAVTTKQGIRGGTSCSFSHWSASRSAPPAARSSTALFASTTAPARAGRDSSVACRSAARSDQKLSNASENLSTQIDGTAVTARPARRSRSDASMRSLPIANES